MTGVQTCALPILASYLDGEDFCFTYGDGVGDVNIRGTVKEPLPIPKNRTTKDFVTTRVEDAKLTFE